MFGVSNKLSFAGIAALASFAIFTNTVSASVEVLGATAQIDHVKTIPLKNINQLLTLEQIELGHIKNLGDQKLIAKFFETNGDDSLKVGREILEKIYVSKPAWDSNGPDFNSRSTSRFAKALFDRVKTPEEWLKLSDIKVAGHHEAESGLGRLISENLKRFLAMNPTPEMISEFKANNGGVALRKFTMFSYDPFANPENLKYAADIGEEIRNHQETRWSRFTTKFGELRQRLLPKDIYRTSGLSEVELAHNRLWLKNQSFRVRALRQVTTTAKYAVPVAIVAGVVYYVMTDHDDKNTETPSVEPTTQPSPETVVNP